MHLCRDLSYCPFVVPVTEGAAFSSASLIELEESEGFSFVHFLSFTTAENRSVLGITMVVGLADKVLERRGLPLPPASQFFRLAFHSSKSSFCLMLLGLN